MKSRGRNPAELGVAKKFLARKLVIFERQENNPKENPAVTLIFKTKT